VGYGCRACLIQGLLELVTTEEKATIGQVARKAHPYQTGTPLALDSQCICKLPQEFMTHKGYSPCPQFQAHFGNAEAIGSSQNDLAKKGKISFQKLEGVCGGVGGWKREVLPPSLPPVIQAQKAAKLGLEA
jgi:hypothetical protein